MRHFLAYLSLILFSLSIHAQQVEVNGNLWLLSESYNNNTPSLVYVKADVEELHQFLDNHNGSYRHTYAGYHSVLLPNKAIRKLAQQNFVEQVYLQGGKGEPLINESRKVTGSHLPVTYKGKDLGPYRGKGVLVGIIDTGIDFTHPDFQSETGKTRVLKIWDQSLNNDSTKRPSYGYGEVYDSSEINAGTCPHVDPNVYSGHGTMVSGILAGNGNSVPDSIADYSGYASASDILFVATDFKANNWSQTVAEAVEWIYAEADQLGLPCVVNISAGGYLGSHDGQDLVGRYIDSLVSAKRGRALVCAAGNAGSQSPFHLRTRVNGDTSFTWFEINPSSGFGGPAVFTELWADTADMNNLTLSFGSTDTSNWSDTTYFVDQIANRLDSLMVQPLGGGSQLMTWAERQGGQYLFQVLVLSPPTGRYYKLATYGVGGYDAWSANWLGLSNMVDDNLPTSGQYANIHQVQLPDSLQSIVSSWNCHPNIISVANFNNRFEYENVDGGMRQTVDLPVGGRGNTSSRGPNRLGEIKPNLGAPGNFTVTTGRVVDCNFLANNSANRYKLAKGGYHFSNGGTSMASPVVAGLIARYFEKCPSASQDELMAALQQTASSDSLTGSLPNFEFGHGKIDAHAFISSSHIYDTIVSSTGELAFCEDDSLELSISTYTLTHWQDSSNTNTQWVDASNYREPWKAYFSNDAGCGGYTDTAFTQMNLNPNVDIVGDSVFCLEDGDTLKAWSNDSNVTWLWSDGSTDSMLIIDSSGTYGLTATSLAGCSNSDSIQVSGSLCYVGISEKVLEGVKVYPNPAHSRLTIESEQGIRDFTLLDASGRVVREQSIRALQFEITVSDLESGLYYLQVNTEQGRGIWPVIVD